MWKLFRRVKGILACLGTSGQAPWTLFPFLHLSAGEGEQLPASCRGDVRSGFGSSRRRERCRATVMSNKRSSPRAVLPDYSKYVQSTGLLVLVLRGCRSYLSIELFARRRRPPAGWAFWRCLDAPAFRLKSGFALLAASGGLGA